MHDFERTREIFEVALAAPAIQRLEVVHQECGDDSALEGDVLSLLRAESQSRGYFDVFLGEVVGAALVSVGASDVDALAEGQRGISRYELVECIADSAMGVVYRARDLRQDRWVALKFLPARLAAERAFRARLFAEGRAASALDHPNIGAIYEIGETMDGRPFIAMAWYDGETLRDRIRRHPLRIEEAIAIAKQVGAALAAAHGAGVIHRDVKPANVLVTSSGVVKLLDFGIAWRTGGEVDPNSGAGTPAYMSPEQARGLPVDARTDLWSLGVVLYEMLTGRRPFAGDMDEMLEEIQRDPPPTLHLLRPDVPAGLESIVSKCLEKDPQARFATADAFRDALDALT